MSELWDMRWLLPSKNEAKAFHCDMVEASKLGDNNGYLDGFNIMALKEESKSQNLTATLNILYFAAIVRRRDPVKTIDKGE